MAYQKYYIDYVDVDGEECNTYVKANSAKEAEEKAMRVYDDIDYITDVYTDRNEVKRRFL